MLTALLSFLLGCALTYSALKVRSRSHAANHQDYKKSWEEAVNLLHASGQLTDEQLAKLLPPKSARPELRQMPGHSSDRRAVEIALAENGLPPRDNLEGMHSSDRRAVELARIKYGTAI